MISLKVVFTANSSWYIYNFRKSTVIDFVEAGFSVVVVVPDNNYTEKLMKLGCIVEYINMSPRSIGIITESKAVLSYLRALRKIAPDLVFSFTPKSNIYAGLVCRFLNINYMPNISGLGGGVGLVAILQKVFYRFSLSKASLLFFQNYSDLAVVKSVLKSSLPNHLVIPGSGVDLEKFDYVNRTYNSTLNFMFVGRLLNKKGIRKFIKLAELLEKKYGNRLRFSVMGFPVDDGADGITFQELNILDAVKINYIGAVDDVSEYMSKADCIVLPTVYGEGVPKSLIEGAAKGCALIASNLSGCRRVVKDSENGFLFDPTRFDDLVAAVEKYTKLDCEQKAKMSIRSRELAESEFDEKIVVSAYAKAARRCMNVFGPI